MADLITVSVALMLNTSRTLRRQPCCEFLKKKNRFAQIGGGPSRELGEKELRGV